MSRPRPSTTRRGSVYALVLAVALFVTVAALAGISASRLRHRTTGLEQSWNDAALLAESAVDHALLSIHEDRWWRQTFASREASFGPETEIGAGAMSWRLEDLVDNDLDDEDSDPLRIHGRGRVGDATRTFSVLAWPTGQPLDVLRATIHAGGGLDVAGILDARGGPVSTNGGLDVGSGQILGDAEALTVDAPENVSGSVTAPAPSRTMPARQVWDAYLAMATKIRLGDIPSATIESVLISPSSNPYVAGDLNPEGVYLVEVTGGQTLRVRNMRISGTLLVKLKGSAARLQMGAGVVMAPARSDFPALIVYTDADLGNTVTVECSGELDELMQGVNFNPSHTPYFGDADSDLADTYPASIRGLVHVMRNTALAPTSRTTIQADRRIFGAIVAEGVVQTTSGSIIVHDPGLVSNPPLGYTREGDPDTLLTNGDVEAGTTGWTSLGGATVETDSHRHGGAYGLRIRDRTSPAHGVGQDVTGGLVSGVTYRSDLWLEMDGDPEDVVISLAVLSSSGGLQEFAITVPKVQTAWTRVVVDLTPTWTGTLAGAQWRIRTTTTDQKFFVDDAILEPVTGAPTARIRIVPGSWRAE